MDACKYIRVEYDTGFGSINALILFPSFIQHAAIAKKLGMPVKSAGFIKDDHCYGESILLKKKCDPVMDEILLKIMMGKQ